MSTTPAGLTRPDWRLLLPAANAADTVSWSHGARISLSEAGGTVPAGGALYGEVADLERAGQELRAAGLVLTGTYAVWPDFNNVQAYIPLAPPLALRWFAANLYPAWTLRKRLLRAAVRFSGGSTDRGAGRLTRSFAVTAVRPMDGGSPPAAFAGATMALDHPALPAALRQASPLLVSHGAERTIVLPFLPDAAAPCAVLKVPRLPAFNEKTIAEQEALTAVRARLDPALRAALPVPGGLLGWDGNAGGIVGVESAMSGRPFVIPGKSWRRASRRQLVDLRLATSWLTEFHRQTELERSLWDDGDITAVAALFERVGSGREERLFAAALRRAELLRGVPLPRVWQHRDFTPWNLLRAAGRNPEIRVLDWEGARPGLPVCDAVHFLTHWHELTRRAFDDTSRRRAFEELWTGRSGSGAAAGAALDTAARYLARLRIDLRFLPLLLTVTWAELAARPGGSGGMYLETLAARGERLFGGGR